MRTGVLVNQQLPRMVREQLTPISAVAAVGMVAVSLFVLKLTVPEVLLGVVGLIAGVFLFLNPMWAFIALVSTFTAENLLGTSDAFTATKLLGAVMVASWAMDALFSRSYRLPRSMVLVFAPSLLACAVISIYVAENVKAAIPATFRILQLNVLVLVTATILRTKKDVERIGWVIVITGLVPVFFILQEVGPAGEVDTEAFLYNRNAMGVFMAIAIPFVFYFFGRVQWPVRLALLGLACLFIIGEALSYSRGGFIIFTVALLLSFALVIRRQRVRSVFAFGIVFALIVTNLPSGVWERAGSILPAVLEGEDTMGLRYQLWKISVRMFEDNPVLGVGPGNYWTHYMRYSGVLGLRRNPLGAHNTFLGIAVEMGLVGLSVFLLLIGATFYSLWRSARQAARANDVDLRELCYCFAIAMVVFMIGGTKGSLEYFKHLWMLFGVSAALLAITAGAAATAKTREEEVDAEGERAPPPGNLTRPDPGRSSP